MNKYKKYKHPKYLEVTKNFLEEKYDFHFNSTNYSPCVLHDEKKGASFQIDTGKDKNEIRLQCWSEKHACTKDEKKGFKTCDIYNVVLALDEEYTSFPDAYNEVKKYFDSNQDDVDNTYWSPFQDRKPLKEKKSLARKVEDLSDLWVFCPYDVTKGYPEDDSWLPPPDWAFLADLTMDAHHRLMFEDDEDKVKKARKFMKEQGFWDEDSNVIKAILKELWIGYTDYIYNTPVCGKEPVEVNRIVFPLFDENGKIKARQFGNPNAKSKRWMFSKHAPIRKLLYGFHETKDHIKERREVYLFEGVKDFLNAIIFDWKKFKNSVATFSCHVTDDQVALLMKCKLKRIIFAYDPGKPARKGMVKAIEKFKKEDPNLEFSYYIYPEGTDAGDAYNTTNPSMKKSFDDYLKDIVFPSSLFDEYIPKGKAKKEYTNNSIAYVVDLGKGIPKELFKDVLEDKEGVYEAYKPSIEELKKKLKYPNRSGKRKVLNKIEGIADFIRSHPKMKCTKKERRKEFYLKCTYMDAENKNGYKKVGTLWIFLLLGFILQKEKGYVVLPIKEWEKNLGIKKRAILKYRQRLKANNYLEIRTFYNNPFDVFHFVTKKKRKSK